MDVISDHAAVDLARFHGVERGDLAGHWSQPPRRWDNFPEDRLLSNEVREIVLAAVKQLPRTQQTVITLRDLEGWEADQVCAVLHLSNGNQRVLLHRARAAIRNRIEAYINQKE